MGEASIDEFDSCRIPGSVLVMIKWEDDYDPQRG